MSMTMEQVVTQLQQESFTLRAQVAAESGLARDDGQFWDLGTKEDQERLERMQQKHQTELLIGSAPCMSFRTLMHPARKE